VTDETRSLWDREAQTFDDAADHGLRDPAIRHAWADLLLPLVGDPGRRVADLGCGTGTLSVLLAIEGRHIVSGVDFSPEMVRRARAKADGIVPAPVFTVADAASPSLSPGSYDVVLARHVLWAMPDPAAALTTWIDLLAPTGVLILIEGRWHTGAGLRASECAELVGRFRDDVLVRPLDDASFWGRAIDDERYLVVSRR
jgi:SAM-dependent methyltransferase